jgi:hypothetical protein
MTTPQEDTDPQWITNAKKGKHADEIVRAYTKAYPDVSITVGEPHPSVLGGLTVEKLKQLDVVGIYGQKKSNG